MKDNKGSIWIGIIIIAVLVFAIYMVVFNGKGDSSSNQNSKIDIEETYDGELNMKALEEQSAHKLGTEINVS